MYNIVNRTCNAHLTWTGRQKLHGAVVKSPVRYHSRQIATYQWTCSWAVFVQERLLNLYGNRGRIIFKGPRNTPWRLQVSIEFDFSHLTEKLTNPHEFISTASRVKLDDSTRLDLTGLPFRNAIIIWSVNKCKRVFGGSCFPKHQV